MFCRTGSLVGCWLRARARAIRPLLPNNTTLSSLSITSAKSAMSSCCATHLLYADHFVQLVQPLNQPENRQHHHPKNEPNPNPESTDSQKHCPSPGTDSSDGVAECQVELCLPPRIRPAAAQSLRPVQSSYISQVRLMRESLVGRRFEQHQRHRLVCETTIFHRTSSDHHDKTTETP